MHTYSCGRVQNQCGPAGLRKPRKSRCSAEAWTGTGYPGLEGRYPAVVSVGKAGAGKQWGAPDSLRMLSAHDLS